MAIILKEITVYELYEMISKRADYQGMLFPDDNYTEPFIQYYKEHYSNSIPISVKYIDNSTSIIKDGPETVKTVKRAGTQSKNTPVLQQHIENYVKRSKVYIPQYHPENVQSSKRSSIKNIRQLTVEEIAKFRNKQ